MTMIPSKTLKIAVLIKSFISTHGAEKYAVEVSRRLAREHEVHVFAQRWSAGENDHITFHRIPMAISKPGFLSEILFSYLCSKYVDSSFDIIHAHVRATRFDLATVHAHCFRNIITRHKTPWRRRLALLSSALSPRETGWLWIEKQQFAFNRKRLILAVSENTKRDIQTNYPLPDESFRIVYPGVDLSLRGQLHTDADKANLKAKLGVKADELVFLFVGTEFRRKGLDQLLEAFAALLPSRVRLLVAGGGGGKMEKYQSLATKLGLSPHVTFLGLVENVGELYAIADAYILPTISDPSPLAPLEAMLCGVPAAFSCAEFCGAAELVKNGEALIIDNPRNPQEIAAILRRLMNADLRAELGQKGQALASALTWENTTANTLAAYAEVMRQKNQR